ncbi:MAG: glycosyltransferase family 2 protein [Gammaproteobacteria bacterium]|nr:glycosyltransferase family 2 protein [Gammaproteobacteria bacterium]
MWLLDGLIEFVQSLTTWQVLAYFWPFFMIDVVRYVLSDIIIFLVHMPRHYFSRERREQARRVLFTEQPLVSVIVPGKNEGKHIPALAESLRSQSYKHYELIIVDDGSDDDTADICRRLESEGRITRFIRNEVRGGKASAANTALRYSRGEYIIHLDADSYLDDDAIETILLPFIMDPAVGAVGGDVRVANIDANIITRLQAIEYLKSISVGRTIASTLGLLRIIAGAHGAFRRDVLERIYGWDVGPGLDGDLTLKVRKMGFKVAHQPYAVCYTHVPDRVRTLAKQRYRWDRSLVRFRTRKHIDILRPSKNFRLSNFLSSAENIFFNLLLDFKWWIYLVQMLFFSAEWLGYIFLINLFLYMSANYIQFITATLLLHHKFGRREYALYLYIPLMPFYYGIYLRTVRTYAYLMEGLHKVSYWDRWNPWKVSRIARKERL